MGIRRRRRYAHFNNETSLYFCTYEGLLSNQLMPTKVNRQLGKWMTRNRSKKSQKKK